MTCKWCDGDCKDMEDHCNKAKLTHFYATHEKRITWGNEYIAPEESFGTWLEIKMVEDEPGTWREVWNFNNTKPSKKTMTEIMVNLSHILLILTDEQFGYSAPYIIQIDNRGYCHLLSACIRDKQESLDMILRHGKGEWVKVR